MYVPYKKKKERTIGHARSPFDDVPFVVVLDLICLLLLLGAFEFKIGKIGKEKEEEEEEEI